MIAQMVIPVNKGKRLIARAVCELPEVRRAAEGGKILMKGGTTVSAVAELFGIPPLRISGRITTDGFRASKTADSSPHSILYQKGKWSNVDESIIEELGTMGPGDAIIIGANSIDMYGVAGMLAGSEAGGKVGRGLIAASTEGIPVIIAAGNEKLVPGSILEISRQSGRKRPEKSMGMAVGIIPLFGKIITESTAVELLTGVSATVIASGGIHGAEGAVALQIEGDSGKVEAALNLLVNLPDTLSGQKQSLISCNKSGSGCSRHLACMYRSDKL